MASFDVLSSILGDARQYVDQSTREKKAANLKFLDRVYAEEQLGQERDYQEDLMAQQRNWDLEQEEADRIFNKQQAAEQLMGSMGFYGPGGANLPLTPEQLTIARDQYEKMFERKRLTDEADRLLVEANTRKANRWLPTVSASPPPPPYLSSHLPGPTLTEQQNRVLVDMIKKGGVLDIGSHTPDLSEPFRQLVGSDADVWQEMYRNVSGEDEPVIFLDAIKILESNEDPKKVAGLVNNIKARMLPIIKGTMTKQLRKFDEQRFSALPDENKEGFVPYASVLESGMERQAEQIFNNMISRMMFDPKTGTLIKGQAQSTGPITLKQIQDKARDDRRANLTHEERWVEDITGIGPNKKSDPRNWYQQRPTSPEAGIFPPVRSKAELAEWWRELSSQEKEKALALMSSEERGLLRELYMERPR